MAKKRSLCVSRFIEQRAGYNVRTCTELIEPFYCEHSCSVVGEDQSPPLYFRLTLREMDYSQKSSFEQRIYLIQIGLTRQLESRVSRASSLGSRARQALTAG